MMINVRINNEELADMLTTRVKYWTEDKEKLNLFAKMYENRCEYGYYEGTEIDIKAMVDSDYIDNCVIVTKGEEYFKELCELYEESESDCSETTCYSYIEAVDDEYEPTMFIVSR